MLVHCNWDPILMLKVSLLPASPEGRLYLCPFEMNEKRPICYRRCSKEMKGTLKPNIGAWWKNYSSSRSPNCSSYSRRPSLLMIVIVRCKPRSLTLWVQLYPSSFTRTSTRSWYRNRFILIGRCSLPCLLAKSWQELLVWPFLCWSLTLALGESVLENCCPLSGNCNPFNSGCSFTEGFQIGNIVLCCFSIDLEY